MMALSSCPGEALWPSERGIRQQEGIKGEPNTTLDKMIRSRAEAIEVAGICGAGIREEVFKDRTLEICIGVLLSLWLITEL